VWSLLDCAADLPQVLAERVRRIVDAAEQVLIERSLRTQRLAGGNPQGLLAFGLPDRVGGVEHLINSFRRNEDDTVIVGEHDVVTCDHVFAEARARERLGLLRIESQRSGRVGSIAEEREADLTQLGCVAVHSPDDERCDAGRLCLEYGQVADAGLVRSARIVDDEDIDPAFDLPREVLTYGDSGYWNAAKRWRTPNGGKLMAWPPNGNVDLFLYREDLLKAAGIAIAETPARMADTLIARMKGQS